MLAFSAHNNSQQHKGPGGGPAGARSHGSPPAASASLQGAQGGFGGILMRLPFLSDDQQPAQSAAPARAFPVRATAASGGGAGAGAASAAPRVQRSCNPGLLGGLLAVVGGLLGGGGSAC
ncbi:MAG TPA: hypothetical protein VGH99_02225 [Pseudonocardia sp.]